MNNFEIMVRYLSLDSSRHEKRNKSESTKVKKNLASRKKITQRISGEGEK